MQARGIAQDVDFNNLALPDREAHDRIQPASRSDNCPHRSIYQRGSGEVDMPRKHERRLGYASRPPHLSRGGSSLNPIVRSHHNVRGKHLQERREIALPHRSEEGIDYCSAVSQISVGNRRCSLDPTPRPAR